MMSITTTTTYTREPNIPGPAVPAIEWHCTEGVWRAEPIAGVRLSASRVGLRGVRWSITDRRESSPVVVASGVRSYLRDVDAARMRCAAAFGRWRSYVAKHRGEE